MGTPRRSSRDIILYVLLYCFSALYMSLGITRALNIYDEGLIVFGAQRVLWGDVPYRDFWTVYSPGQFYVLAALFRTFGSTILVERIWDTLIRAALAVVCMAYVQRLSSRGMGIMAWLVVMLWLGFYEFYGYPIYAALLLSFSSFLALLHLDKTAHPARLMLLAGISLGAACLFRHDFGSYALLTELAVFIPLILSGYVSPQGEKNWQMLKRLGLPYLAGLAVVLVPAIGLLLLAVPFTTLWESLVVFPLTIFPLVRALPYPHLLPDIGANWPYYFPYLILGIAAIYTISGIIRLHRRKLDTSRVWILSGIACLLLYALVSLNQSRIRADLIHLAGLLIVCFVISFSLVGLAWNKTKIAGGIALGVFLVLLVPFGRLIVNERIVLFERGIWAATPNTAHQIPAAVGMPVEPNQAAAVRYVRANVPESTPIYVAVSRHDRIFVNDALFYFLAGRRCACRYNELHPGVATTRAVQEEIVNDLERLQVPLVVRFSMFEGVTEPNDSAKSSGVRIVDIYLAENYQADRSFGPYYQVLKRKTN